MVKSKSFTLDKATACELHAIAGKEETRIWGKFRDGAVIIAGTDHKPPATEKLDDIYKEWLEYINRIESPIEKAMVCFLFGSIHSFFYGANKRVFRLLMNGVLLSAGYDTINIPAKRRHEFNEKMVRFYNTKDGTEMMEFLATCSLDTKLAEIIM
jgi:Fic family protein